MIRTHQAGTLRAAHAGQTVTLTGWVARRRDHGGVAFIDLRDASGFVQVVVRDEAVAAGLRNEFVPAGRRRGERCGPRATPTPTCRPARSRSSPADGRGAQRGGTAAVPDRRARRGRARRCGCKYRYLDLRRPAPRRRSGCAARSTGPRARCCTSATSSRSRRPTLTRSTPEGARDFLVPARLPPGSWYALPQSPQLFKQLLMVAGMERYFQIARVLPRRGLPRRPAAGVHPARHRDELRRPGRRDRDRPRRVIAALWKLIGHEIPTCRCPG